MRRLLLYALLIPLLISCGTGGEQRCIVAADSLMENNHGTVEHLRGLAGKGTAMSVSEWTDFEGTMRKLMSEFYVKIEHSKAQLTDQEFKVCLLTRMKFSSSDISNLLGTSQQRVTNIKSSINEKLFHKKGSKSLLANLSLM